MPIPSAISDLSTTPASNFPAGSESPSTIDDYLRTYASYIALLRDGKGQSAELTLASAATVDIGASNSPFVNITGTTTITSFGTNYTGARFIRFSGSLTLTHNVTTLILPGGANITTAAGDACIAVPYASGWRVAVYQRANGEALGLADGSVTLPKLATSVYGTSGANKLLQLDGTGKLPPLDGSQLTGLNTSKQIQPISASVAANALTLTLNPTTLDFRYPALNNGSVTTRSIAAAISLVVPSGATLGTVNGQAARLAVLAIDAQAITSAGQELAVVNLSGGANLDETTLISTTAISGTSNSASTVYSSTARTNVPFRVVGFIDITEATAGTWATAPSTIQGAGGQALAAMASLGFGQTWQSVTRVAGTTYYNTTGKPLQVYIIQGVSTTLQLTVNGFALPSFGTSGTQGTTHHYIIPVGASYSVTGSFNSWSELR